jgi:hypothetical protein
MAKIAVCGFKLRHRLRVDSRAKDAEAATLLVLRETMESQTQGAHVGIDVQIEEEELHFAMRLTRRLLSDNSRTADFAGTKQAPMVSSRQLHSNRLVAASIIVICQWALSRCRLQGSCLFAYGLSAEPQIQRLINR